MKNLLLFIWKHSFFFWFLILEGVASFLIVSNNSYQRTSFINASNGFTASILSASNKLTHYIGLSETNDELAKENAQLRELITNCQNILGENIYEYSDSIQQLHYRYQNAKIISNSFQKRNNYLIINKGSKSGIKPLMGVITSSGIIGIVKDVSDNFSTVISVLHSKSAIDIKIKNNGYTGTLVWPGQDYIFGKVKNIPSHVHLTIGDTITTSGNSSIFPDHILVGTISDFQLNKGASFYDIEIKFSVDYNKIKHVYIINNTLKDELNKLKALNEDE